MGFEMDDYMSAQIQAHTYALANQRILERVLAVLKGTDIDAFEDFDVEVLLKECNEEAIECALGDDPEDWLPEDEEDEDDEW